MAISNYEYTGGDLSITNHLLDSLCNCPQHITGDFDCSDNQLDSLEYGPKIVDGSYDCSYNHLTSLEGCVSHVGGVFSCDANRLYSLVGGPERVDGKYNCSNNYLNNLDGCASHISELNFISNNITSLVGIHKIIKKCKKIVFDAIRIKQGGIGLLLIADLEIISSNTPPFSIISKYLGTGTKGMMECSKELTAKGYANYAKL